MKKIFLFLSFLLLLSCSEDKDRQEVIDKLRGIGSITSPLVSTPSLIGQPPEKVEVTVHLALPLGKTVTVEPYKDQETFSAILLEEDQIAVKSGTIKYAPYADFQVVSFKADLTVPIAEFFTPLGGAGQVRYGFLVKSGTDEEKVIGNFLVYPENSPELSWTSPQITVEKPIDESTVKAESEIEIKASLVNSNDEDLLVGWLVGGGEIKNRRAKETKWKTPGVGKNTLIATVRGKKSRGFGIQIIEINTN